MPEPPSDTSVEVVYILGTPGSKTVKIGRTIDLRKRLADIQRMSPVPLQALWSHPGGCELETNLHRQFSALRTHGEWFTFGSDPVASIQWAIKDQPWLRKKISLKKKAPPTPRAPKTPARGPEDSPAQLGVKVSRMWNGLTSAFSALSDIKDPVERHKALQLLEEALPDEVRETYRSIAADLKLSGRTWREVGEVMGGVSAQRAHQISLGGAPLYGAKAAQAQQAG